MFKLKLAHVLAFMAIFITPLFAEETYNTSGGAVTFKFKYNTGDNYRILSTVNEDVLVNRRLHHQAEIINRISTTITGVKPDGSATHDSIFMTSENSLSSSSSSAFVWAE